MNDRDLIGSAQTGTGKTAAFLLPVLNELVKEHEPVTSTLIIVPTRELAVQIDQQIQGFSYFTPVESTAIYGGGDGLSWEQQKKARPSLLSAPQHWGSGQLQNGILTEIGPWRVAMNSEKKVLCIMDESSPYNGLEIHRFKALIVKPLGLEFAHRHKQEEKAAVAENRKRKKVNYPDPPSWNPASDMIEYHGISNDVIRKLKQEN